MSVQFLVHEDGDSVGVITVEGVKAGQELTGWIMKEDKTITFKVLDDIPIGHKIALKDLNVGDTVFKYGTDIGKVVKPIRQGEHLHVHNVKTKRWEVTWQSHFSVIAATTAAWAFVIMC